MENAPGNFPYVSGKLAEWRYKGKIPIAVIFRIAATKEIYKDDDSPPIFKEKSKLLIVSIAKNCVIGVTDSNEEARYIADGKHQCQTSSN
jgi:hypothetical protein